MEAKLMESKSCFSLHLDGESEIDASLLSKTIGDMAELAKFAAKENNPEAYLKMNVTAFKNGSFQIDFSAICQTAEQLVGMLPAAATFAAAVTTTIVGFITIKKHLKGQKAKSITQQDEMNISVENSEGVKIIAPKNSAAVINNTQIDQLVVNIGNYVEEHNPNGGFSLATEDGENIFTKADVKSLSTTLPMEIESVCIRNTIETDLPIKKLDIMGRSKWTFRYNEKNIEATISDDDFLEFVHHGAPVKSGDWIKATLEIYVDLDLNGKPIEDSAKYTIKKVHGGIQHEYKQDDYQVKL